MRSDNLPWLYYEIGELPNEGDLQSGSLSEDHLGEVIQKCLWMWQGVFSSYSETNNDVINLPHAFCKLEEGMILTNGVTRRKYRIVKVLGQFRDDKYTTPPIEDTPESIPMRNRQWISSYHPDELTGGSVQIAPADNIDSIDLDRSKGHFLSLHTSKRPHCRIIYSEQASESEGAGEEDIKAGMRSGYEIEIVIARSGPNQGNQPFGDTKNPAPRQYQGDRKNIATSDATYVEDIWGQHFDTHLEFNLKSPNTTELGWMAQWFQIFMWRYSPVIERLGFTKVLYDARFGGKISPLKKPEAGDMIKLRYNVRWERIFPSRKVKMRGTTLHTDIVRPDGEPGEELDPPLET